MATSEIDKLERRYAENPHGLTFAPLAEVHRKNGDTARALELLRIGLELHPNYIPASIVLGRCHQDLGDLPEAEAAFAHVLRLDDENVIALKSLADMNERQGRLDEAERWLRRLVSVDRSNDEARQQLERIEAAQAEAATREETPAPTPMASSADETAKSAETPQPAAPVASVPEQPSAPAEIPALELMDDVRPAAAERMSEPVAQLETSSTAVSKQPPAVPQPEPPRATEAAPLAGLESSEFEPPKFSPNVQGPLGLEIETESEVVLNSSGASEFSVPDASQDLAALAAKMNASRPRNPGRRASDAPRAEVKRSPPVTEPAVEPTPPTPAPTPQLAAKVYSASATKGQSVAAFFQSLLSARPPEKTTISPLHPSPSSPNGESPPTGGSEGQQGVVSFDDFFGAAAGGESRETGGGQPGKDDLDQFHSWLQNLKR